ncbi:MAG: pilus assembly protein N-terminal domain-containing protein [Gemmobacter sp.]|nr:pilus assembly protein N-terminal domain-containing protein [Gemmobacter sp.]
MTAPQTAADLNAAPNNGSPADQCLKAHLCLWIGALAVWGALALAPGLARAEVVVAAYPEPQQVGRAAVEKSLEKVVLAVDFVVVVPIGADIGTILLGNSAIADATLTDGRMIVLKGVAQGLTNLIVLDTEGNLLTDIVVQVSDRKPGTVTVRRAMVMQSYACADELCESTGSSGAQAAPPGLN